MSQIIMSHVTKAWFVFRWELYQEEEEEDTCERYQCITVMLGTPLPEKVTTFVVTYICCSNLCCLHYKLQAIAS